MGVAVRSEAATVDDATVAKLRARFERERRAGHGEADEAIQTVIEDAQAAGKRRRRKKEDLPPTPEAEPEAEPAMPRRRTGTGRGAEACARMPRQRPTSSSDRAARIEEPKVRS